LVDRILVGGWPLRAAAEAAGISERTAYRWLRRWREQGQRGLFDRSSAPKRIPHRSRPGRVEAIRMLRRLRMTAAQIGECLGMALSTVSAVLGRIGLGKRSRLEPLEAPNRYCRRRPGGLVHLDVKKLGRIVAAGHRVTASRASQKKTRRERKRVGVAGWELVHVCVDDATRLAYVEVPADEQGQTAADCLRRAVAWFAERGVRVEQVMSDTGSCYRSARDASACRELALRHLRTRPHRPRTNGKAERFIGTLLDEWAYGAIYGGSHQRAAALPGWLIHYNYRRQHGSLGHQPPAARLNELTDLARNYI